MSDGESARQSSYGSSPSSEHNSGDVVNPPAASEGEGDVMFNLSDPTDMEVKLSQLTDEEMDELLKQAYKVNKELKTELMRQEDAQPTKMDKSKKTTSQPASLQTSSTSSRTSSSLPPIRNASGRNGGFTSLNHRPSAQLYATPPVRPSRTKAKTAVQQPITKGRPEWNDRFNL